MMHFHPEIHSFKLFLFFSLVLPCSLTANKTLGARGQRKPYVATHTRLLPKSRVRGKCGFS